MLTLEVWQTIYASAWGGDCENCGLTGAGIKRILLKSLGLVGFTSPSWKMAAGRLVCASSNCWHLASIFPFLNC